jgi:hypothetical protein
MHGTDERLLVPETTPADNSGGPATALADPPQPPATPPGSVAAGTPDPGRKRTAIILTIVLSVIAVAFVAFVVWLVMATTKGSSGTSDAATKAAYASAMQKAGVNAPYPGGQIAIASATPSGSHPFAATFTPEEIAALLNTFAFESDAAGMRISLRNVSLSSPASGVVKLSANVTANGGTYGGEVTLPLTFAAGRLDSTGVTDLMVEGISANDGQKAQAGGALVDYFNAYLAAAPGLKIESATLGADGVRVSGTAPDSLTFH